MFTLKFLIPFFDEKLRRIGSHALEFSYIKKKIKKKSFYVSRFFKKKILVRKKGISTIRKGKLAFSPHQSFRSEDIFFGQIRR